MILPACLHGMRSHDQIDMEIAATRVMLALETFAARNGRYPAALSELTPSILPALPIDPESLKPFGYRLLKPGEDTLRRGDGTERPYLLYSLGADATDRGGHFKWKNNYTVLVNGNLTEDFVINLPRYRPEFEADQ